MRALFIALCLVLASSLVSAQVSESLCEQIDYIKSEFQVYEQVAKSTAYAIDIFGENVSPVELAEMVRQNVANDATRGIYGSAIAFEPGTYDFSLPANNISRGVPDANFQMRVAPQLSSYYIDRTTVPVPIYCPYSYRGSEWATPGNEDDLFLIDLADGYDYSNHSEGGSWYGTPRDLFNAGTFPAEGYWSPQPYFDANAGGICMVTYSYPFTTTKDLSHLGNVPDAKGRYFWGIATIDIPMTDLRVWELYEYPSYLISAVWMTAILVELYLICILCVVLYFRKDRIIKATSVSFNLIILIAACLLTLTSVVFTIYPDEANLYCNVRLWAVSLLVVLMYAPLFIKTYRIDRIFHMSNKLTNRPKLNDLVLLKGVAVLVLLQFLVLLGSTLNPSTRSEYELDRNEMISTDTRSFEVRQCTVNQFAVTFTFFFIGMLAIWGAYLAVRVRNVPSAFSETTHILVAMMFFAFYMVIIVPLQFMVDEDPEVVALLRGFGISFGVFVTISAIFLPKLDAIRHGRANEKAKTNELYQWSQGSRGKSFSGVDLTNNNNSSQQSLRNHHNTNDSLA